MAEERKEHRGGFVHEQFHERDEVPTRDDKEEREEERKRRK